MDKGFKEDARRGGKWTDDNLGNRNCIKVAAELGGQRSKKDPAKVLAEASDILDETKDDVGVEAATALDRKCERWGAHRTPMHA